MSQDRKVELRELLFSLERRIKPLEWDSSRNQINEFKLRELGRMKEEFANFKQELEGLEQELSLKR